MAPEANKSSYLESLELKHAPLIFQTIDKHRDKLREWLPFVDSTQEEQDSIDFVEHVLSTQDVNFAIYHENTFAGLIGLKDVDYANKRAEIGYWLSPEFQNRGIMTESCFIVIDHAFGELQLNRLQIRVAVGNEKSIRIADKFGFQFEGVEREGERLVSGFTDVNVYSLLKEEWE